MTSFIKMVGYVLLSTYFFVATNSHAQPRIDLSEGTVFLTGGLTFDYTATALTQTQHDFRLVSNLGGGYFIIDNLVIGLSIPTEWRFSPQSGGEIGFKGFSAYFFDIDSVVFPYVGGSITPGYSMSERSFKLKTGLDGGVLVSMSDSVALDFGIRPELTFKLYDTQHWKFSLPTGFVGIVAVF